MAAVHIIMAIGAYGCKTGLAEENGKGDFMEKREETIRLWFDMWLQQKDLGIDDIFTEDVIYIESWSPKYENRITVKHCLRK